MTPYTLSELEAYLDEALPVERMTALEEAARSDAAVRERLAGINARRNAGVHTLGEIWRQQRLSCPTRAELGSLLLNVLPDEHAAYLRFHLETVGCRYCQANLADIQRQQSEQAENSQRRRRKYFQSSAGQLKVKG